MHLGLAGVWKSSFLQRYWKIDCGVGVLFFVCVLVLFFSIQVCLGALLNGSLGLQAPGIVCDSTDRLLRADSVSPFRYQH